MGFLDNQILAISEYKQAVEALKSGANAINISGPSDSQKAHISFCLLNHTSRRGLYVTFNEMQARRLFEDLAFFMGDGVVFIPAKELMLHDVEAKSYNEIHNRLKAFNRIIKGDFTAIVTSIEALMHKMIPPALFKEYTLKFENGQRISVDQTIEKLVTMGYERVPVVEGQGQFSVRGGIIDIFAVNLELPVRIELWDDEVDSLRTFDISTQRSIDKVNDLEVIPAREIIYKPERATKLQERIKGSLLAHLKKIKGKTDIEHYQSLESRIVGDIDKIAGHHYFPGIDKYIPFIMQQTITVFDYIPKDTLVIFDEKARMEQRAENVILEHQEACKSMLQRGRIIPESIDSMFSFEDILNAAQNNSMVYLSTIASSGSYSLHGPIYSIPSKQATSYQGHIDLLLNDISVWKQNGFKILILSGTKGKGLKLIETLKNNDIEAYYKEEAVEELLPGSVVVTHGSLHKGFEYPSIGLAIVSDKEIFGHDKRSKRTPRQEGAKIKAFTDLNVGDYVVHQSHGIGQYAGIEKLEVENVKKDYIKIRYHSGDSLYIPTDQLDIIQKYIGSEGKTPKLSKLGSTEWAKTKNRVKESLMQLAEGLVKLYAERQNVIGHKYSQDTVWQKQFEEQFPYEETEDQLRCIEEIKSDMESPKVMDRLLCGDVGYGKTEVAIRAVFKAVMDGKQVAYLVPTTILAQQQYESFKKRMEDFAVTVDVISRFRSPGEQKKILKDVKSGAIDVLIGTHRLLQKDIHFKDLGLLIVDEEQRFGVGHKEKLKEMKTNVDVLTLSATPIPRTLHMSLVGIRDISVIEQPPEERYPVQTYVMEYNQDIVRDAIVRELSRKGQTFYLYNRVRGIQLKADELQNLIPEARIAYAHGQMDEKRLEEVMMDFLNKEYDVLVCTTIIESGLDIPNVNTIIVEDADRMGLSQLYQIRGRVGRSNRLAYAYITYKKDKILNEVAEKRLQAIKEFTEFGSGFKIAMRDLEIRGAGNLLGPEQHGHMESVGYEMYCKLLDEAIHEIKGEPLNDNKLEIAIDIGVSAYIDNSYIHTEIQKIEMYKRIASIDSEEDMLDVMDELIDRYGEMPQAVQNLISIAYIKVLAKKCGFSSISEKNNALLLQYANPGKVDIKLLGAVMDKYKGRLLFTASNAPYVTFKLSSQAGENVLDETRKLLEDIIELHS